MLLIASSSRIRGQHVPLATPRFLIGQWEASLWAGGGGCRHNRPIGNRKRYARGFPIGRTTKRHRNPFELNVNVESVSVALRPQQKKTRPRFFSVKKTKKNKRNANRPSNPMAPFELGTPEKWIISYLASIVCLYEHHSELTALGIINGALSCFKKKVKKTPFWRLLDAILTLVGVLFFSVLWIVFFC